MHIKLSEHFTYKKLLRFTLPSVAMMIFTSIYGVVDGIFVSNFAGKTAFAAVNFAWPFLMILSMLGFVFGTGGSAIIAKTMGEGDKGRANRIFSMIVYTSIICSVVLTVLGLIFVRPILALLGAEGQMLDDSVTYAMFIIPAVPAATISYEFQNFFPAAEKPRLGLAVTVAAGVLNMALDALFVGALRWGIPGAAAATALSQILGGIIPIIYFSHENSSLLRLTKPEKNARILLRTLTNGSSELMSNVSMSLVNMLYNVQLLKYAGEDGVSAYGVLMYVCLVFLAIFIGFSVGSAPIISYNYGAQNTDELKNLRRKSLTFIVTTSVAMLFLSETLARPLSRIFTSYDGALYDLTVRGFAIYSFSFLFAGIAIFGSSFFTALNNGLVSALISFLRTLVFQIAAVMILPIFFDIDGIWISVVAAEFMAFTVTSVFMFALRKKYDY